ncbi:MAG: acyl-CoA synthetase [Bacteroidetes bacterium]|nr:acyl-CoA synthetase [Bacteroidota bacterium]
MIWEKAQAFPERTAVWNEGNLMTYGDLLNRSAQVASFLVQQHTVTKGERVAFMVEPSFDYVSIQWGIWRAGGIAVPLCLTNPSEALDYVLRDTTPQHIIASGDFFKILKPLADALDFQLSKIEEIGVDLSNLPEVALDDPAMIIYTSGTTNKPKGVVSTHRNILAQIDMLCSGWEISASDHILCVLPLHHIHGIIAVVGCTLWSGGTVEFLPKFSPEAVFKKFLAGRINTFMAVPTVYFKLIAFYESLEQEEQSELTRAMKAFRLMVSGSAALPVSVMEKWKAISGQTLLERYGMTETGMTISNPYHGERKPGHIGMPLKGVQVRLTDEKGKEVFNEAGEIQIRGEMVFSHYWKKPEATRETFTGDGWFRTGDVAEVRNGYYRILGRSSTDIIKSGGYKISALEIEEIIREYPGVEDCAVVGLEDEEWGELIAAALVGAPDLDLKLFNENLRTRLAGYKLPRNFRIVKELPRNAMGKVIKAEVKKLFKTEV